MDYIYKSYKFKLKLTTAQEKRVNAWIATCRCVYNLALEARKYEWAAHKGWFSKYDLQKQITGLRGEFKWVRDVPASSLQEVLTRQEKAYSALFNGRGFPRYAKRAEYNSISFTQDVKLVREGVIRVPKLGDVKYFVSRGISGGIRGATIIRKNGNFYISILTRHERPTSPHPNHDSQVGIDMGLAFFASLSTGEQIDNPRFFIESQRKLRIAQRSLARKTKGSKGYDRQALIVGRLHEKIKNQREDFLHKLSRIIINKHGFVAVEDLRIANMVKFGYLGKHVSDAGWGTFINQLEYKADWSNGTIVKVDPRYTSQTCNDCGSVDKKSRISQSKFVCTECGAESNADINAAKNILGRALSIVR